MTPRHILHLGVGLAIGAVLVAATHPIATLILEVLS